MDRTLRAPVDEFTVQTKGVVEAKTVVPTFDGDVVALTECVPVGSPGMTPTGRFPKDKLSGAARFTVVEAEE
jgi:hypothetical protein